MKQAFPKIALCIGLSISCLTELQADTKPTDRSQAAQQATQAAQNAQKNATDQAKQHEEAADEAKERFDEIGKEIEKLDTQSQDLKNQLSTASDEDKPQLEAQLETLEKKWDEKQKEQDEASEEYERETELKEIQEWQALLAKQAEQNLQTAADAAQGKDVSSSNSGPPQSTDQKIQQLRQQSQQLSDKADQLDQAQASRNAQKAEQVLRNIQKGNTESPDVLKTLTDDSYRESLGIPKKATTLDGQQAGKLADAYEGIREAIKLESTNKSLDSGVDGDQISANTARQSDLLREARTAGISESAIPKGLSGDNSSTAQPYEPVKSTTTNTTSETKTPPSAGVYKDAKGNPYFIDKNGNSYKYAGKILDGDVGNGTYVNYFTNSSDFSPTSPQGQGFRVGGDGQIYHFNGDKLGLVQNGTSAIGSLNKTGVATFSKNTGAGFGTNWTPAAAQQFTSLKTQLVNLNTNTLTGGQVGGAPVHQFVTRTNPPRTSAKRQPATVRQPTRTTTIPRSVPVYSTFAPRSQQIFLPQIYTPPASTSSGSL